MSGGSPSVLPQRVCFFGTYARTYTVSQILLRAVRDTGAEVIECHEPLWEKEQVKSQSYFGWPSLARNLAAYTGAGRTLARRWKGLGEIDLYVVGFQGQLDLLLLKRLLRSRPVPVLFAPLVTLTETLVEDRKTFRSRSPQAALLRALDRLTLRVADRTVIDAQKHAEYLVQELRAPRERLSVWHIGCDTDVFRAEPPPPSGSTLRILFYGSFLPLHGVPTILAAAHQLLGERDIIFELYGDGIELSQCRLEAEQQGLTNVRFHPWLPYAQLGQLVAQHDICLGVFGHGKKPNMVIPNKVYQAAAVGRPVITLDTPAVREVFAHGQSIWLCPGDAAALAQAILLLGRDTLRRKQIGSAASELMRTRFSRTEQARQIGSILAEARAI